MPPHPCCWELPLEWGPAAGLRGSCQQPVSAGLCGYPTCPLARGGQQGPTWRLRANLAISPLGLDYPSPSLAPVPSCGNALAKAPGGEQGTHRSGCSTPGSHHAPLAPRVLGLLPHAGVRGTGRAPPQGKMPLCCGGCRAPVPRKRAGVCAQLTGGSPSGFVPLQPSGQPAFQKEQMVSPHPSHGSLPGLGSPCPALWPILGLDAC